MSEFDKIAAALVAFQGEVPVIPKNRVAKIPTKTGGSYSYKYADLSDIWDAIRGPLRMNGLAVTQQLCGPVGSPEVGITTTIWHESGQCDSSTIYVSSAGKNPQEVGSLLTYFKRYALSAALGISVDDDDDAGIATHAPEPPAARPTNTSKPKSESDIKRDQLRAIAQARNWDLKKVAALYAEKVNGGGGNLATASAEDVEAFITSLETGVVTI